MPYISQKDRSKYYDVVTAIHNLPEITTKGDLEFVIFLAMRKFMSTREEKYSHLHDCTYAANHCADEFRRRFLDKREDRALEANGDIIP